jgi:hypothetical protein
MAFPPAGATRWVFSGTAGTSEEFATGFWTVGSSATDETSLLAQTVGMLTIWAATAKAPWLHLVASDTQYQALHAYRYDGTSSKSTLLAATAIAAALGTSGTGSVNPMQTCMVQSLHSGFAGATKRGRMYLPATGAGLSGHQFADGDVDGANAGTAGFLTAVAADLVFGVPSIVSTKLGSATPIVSVQTDSEPDIQRRRARSVIARRFARTDV